MTKCTKPGCGAINLIGSPCTDRDCPQQWVHHNKFQEYRYSTNEKTDNSSATASRIATLERELELAKAALEEARETNRRFQRRLQELESGEAALARKEGYWELRSRSDYMSSRWMHEFDRVLSLSRKMKEIFEVAAPVLGLPHDKYHSVMDSSFNKMEGAERGAYANVYLPEGGIASYDVVKTVQQAIEKLQKESSI